MHASSDSELQSELEDDVLAVLSSRGIELKPAFVASLCVVVFFIQGPSFDNAVDVFSEDFLTSKMMLLKPLLVDSRHESDSEEEPGLSFV